MRMKLKVLRALLRPNPPDISKETLEFASSKPQGPDKLATILSGEAKKLLAMDRYERRALSRRKFAIRAFDAATAGVMSRGLGESFQSSAWSDFAVARIKFATWAAARKKDLIA